METKKTALIVDDELSWLNLVMIEILANAPFDLLFARNATQALKLLQTNPVDIIVTDTNMPKIDGIHLLLSIREKDAFIPIIVLFSELQGSDVTAEEVYKMGADVVMTKGQAITDLKKEMLRLTS